jgi:hypothetical protein
MNNIDFNDNGLRKKLIKFLKLDIFFWGVQKQLKCHKEEIQKYRTEIKEYQKMVIQLAKEIKQYQEQLKKMELLGADIHMHSPSWGVICVNSKKPYVKFFEISQDRNIREIQQIVRHLQPDERRTIIDSPIPFMHGNIDRY